MRSIIDAINNDSKLVSAVGMQLSAVIGWIGGFFVGRISNRGGD